MKKPLIISLLFHGALVLLAIFGLPHLINNDDIIEAVPVEIVSNISELTTTNKPPVKAPPKEDKKPEPPKPKKETPKPPVQKAATPPPPEEDVLKEPPKEPEKVVEKKPEPVKKEPPKKDPPKKKPPKKDPPKEKPKEEEEDFDDMLKNLSPDKAEPEASESETTKPSTPTPSPNISKFSDVLSMSERDALISQLAGCWNIMAGSANAENMAVEIKVVVNQDRTVRDARVVDTGRYGSDTFFRAAADSALRALRNPRCTPLNLPPEKYSEWQNMTINFDPKDMFR